MTCGRGFKADDREGLVGKRKGYFLVCVGPFVLLLFSFLFLCSKKSIPQRKVCLRIHLLLFNYIFNPLTVHLCEQSRSGKRIDRPAANRISKLSRGGSRKHESFSRIAKTIPSSACTFDEDSFSFTRLER